MKISRHFDRIVLMMVALASSLSAWQVFGQDSAEYAENVPLTYTLVSWSSRGLAPDDQAGEEQLKRGARRSDGSTVLATYDIAEDGTASIVRGIVDLENARYRIVDSAVRSVTTTRLAEQAVANKGSRREGCDGEIVSSALGHDVARRTSMLRVPTSVASRYGQMREESLVAPALGCLVMERRTIMAFHDGTERPVRVERVVDVRLGEPDDSLFKVPEDYVEMSPAERLVALGRSENPSNDQIIQHWEDIYRQRRAH